MAYVVGAGVPLLPLNQEQLGHHQRSDEDEDHFSVHGFVATVLGMHARMLHPESQTKGRARSGKVWPSKGSAFQGRPTIPQPSVAAVHSVNEGLQRHTPWRTGNWGYNGGPRHRS